MNATTSASLEQLCDKASDTLERALKLLQVIRTGDRDAVSELHGMCKSSAYDGESLCVPLEDLFMEIEALDCF